MAAILTGASGNLGQELIKQADFDFVQVNRNDWLNLDQIFASGIDVVIHAASDLHTRVDMYPTNLLDSNVLSTAKILESVRKHNIPRFIYISSCSVYGTSLSSHEINKCSPVSLNGITKLLNEKLIEEYCSANKIKFEILRVFNLYGGQDRFSIFSNMKKSLENNQPFILNNKGIAQRDFIHVSDIAGIILFILNTNMPYPYLNIGTGSATKVSFLVDLVKQKYPDFQVMHSEVQEAKYSRADISKLSNLIDWNFLRIEDYLHNEFKLNNNETD